MLLLFRETWLGHVSSNIISSKPGVCRNDPDSPLFVTPSPLPIQGLFLSVWNLVMDTMTGVYVEVAFIDGALNFGQGVFAFLLFGLDNELIILPLVHWWVARAGVIPGSVERMLLVS